MLAHVLAAWTLFGLTRRTLQSPRLAARFADRATSLAFAIALLWLLHPLHTSALDHVSYRNEVLMGLSPSHVVLLRARHRGGPARSPAAGGTHLGRSRSRGLLLGMACKEVMVTHRSSCSSTIASSSGIVPGSLAPAGAALRGARHHWLLLALLVATSHRGDSASIHIRECTPLDYARTQFGVVADYLRSAFWPHPLVIDSNWPVAKSLGPVWPAIAGIVALWTATLFALRRRPAWGFLGVWFFLILAPTSSIMPLTGAIVGEHRMYLSLVAPVALAVMGIYLALESLPWTQSSRRLAGAGLVVAAALVLGGMTFGRNRDYRSEAILWTDALAKSPGNPRAHNNLGSALVQEGRIDAAIDHFEEAVRLDPQYADAYANLGSACIRQGNLEAALEALHAALGLDPRNAQAHYSLGLALLRQGHLAESAAAFGEALRLQPGMAEAHRNLGLVHLQQGRYDAAVEQFRAAIAENPEHASARNDLAWVLATCPEERVRRGAEAVTQAERAVEMTRNEDPEMLDTLAAAYAEAGRFDAAVTTVERAARLAAQRGRADLSPKLAGRLELYTARRPFRMPAPSQPSR